MSEAAGLRSIVFKLVRWSLLPLVYRRVFRRNRVTILVYHAPSRETTDKHLRVLKSLYTVITLRDYLHVRKRGGKLATRPIVITYDDGHVSNFHLKDAFTSHGVLPTLFVCAGIVGTKRHFWFLHDHLAQEEVQALKELDDDERLGRLRNNGFCERKEYDERQGLSLEEMRELQGAVDFQSHTVFHPILTRCSDDRTSWEIAESKRALDGLGFEVYALAYPNGSYSEREARAAEQAGYSCALSLEEGANDMATPLFRLGRTCIPDDAGIDELIVKSSGVWSDVVKLTPSTVRRWWRGARSCRNGTSGRSNGAEDA